MTLALQGADLATWDWDVKTDSIIRNKRWSEMLGYEEGEIDESLELFTDLVHPDDRQFSWDALDAHLEGKTDSFEAEHRMRHKSGGWVWVLDRGRVLEWDLDGKPLRICGTHLDITKRREAEQQLKKLNKAKDELIAGVSHELRTSAHGGPGSGPGADARMGNFHRRRDSGNSRSHRWSEHQTQSRHRGLDGGRPDRQSRDLH